MLMSNIWHFILKTASVDYSFCRPYVLLFPEISCKLGLVTMTHGIDSLKKLGTIVTRSDGSSVCCKVFQSSQKNEAKNICDLLSHKEF